MSGSFTAQIDAFVAKTQQRMEAVFKQSVQDVVEAAQLPVAQGGNMPKDTGFLQNSFVMNSSGFVAINPKARPTDGASYTFSVASVLGEIASLKMGGNLYGSWTASYARHVEYGARGRIGRFFMRGAAQQWPAIVAKNTAELKARIK